MARSQDVIVVGGDLTGYTAALEARRLGLGVLLVEPLADAAVDGVEPPDLHALREVARRIIHRQGPARRGTRPLGDTALAVLRVLRKDVRQRALAGGVRIANGQVSLESPTTAVLAEGERHEARTLLLATGTRARPSTRFPIGGVVCSPEGALAAPGSPRSVLVVGAEMLGCEIACMLASTGASVTLLDRRSRLLRFADRSLLEVLHHRMRELGISVVLEEEICALELCEGGSEPHAVVRLGSGRMEHCDRVVVAGGRSGRTDGLGLDRIGVELDGSGRLVTDEYFQSSCAGVYGVGDVVGGSGDTLSVAYQARTALRHALGEQWTPEEHTPLVIHTLPELAMVGFTDEACRLLEVPCVTGVARYGETPGGSLGGHPDDLVKLVFSRSDLRLLGVHWLGKGAVEMTHLGAVWLRQAATARALADAPFAPFSLAELYRTAALDAIAASDASRV